ncbi:MAG: filamentous hemagglutinin protein [Solimicrobium sp.]|nr:filamentous hemagglutinin protein [Solimicrobium sp.]
MKKPMNKQSYRVIFSQVIGTFIAVAEKVSGRVKTKSESFNIGSVSMANAPVSNKRSLSIAILSLLTTLLFAPSTAVHAQMVAYKNGTQQQPIIDQSANGRPVVQIVTPNASGLSHNRYDQFNVDKNGVILNNSATVSKTQLGGYIEGNSNVARGSGAKIILNEVMSTSRSELQGFMEVAGQRAEVIVANPNGISVSGGAGFLNTSRATLTTGTATFSRAGNLAGFQVSTGDISIGSGGMNATEADQLDLISRSVQINEVLWAKRLNIVAGSNEVDYANLDVQIMAGKGERPTVGIDSSALGGMYAQKIILVGTEAGVGVKTLGAISASSGDLSIDAHGKISLQGQTSAAGQIHLHSNDDFSNVGTLYGQQSVNIASNGKIANSGTLAALHDLTVNANNISSPGDLASGINATGQVAEAGVMTLTAAGSISVTGKSVVGSNMFISGSEIRFADENAAATISTKGDVSLTATAGDLNHEKATLEAAGRATLSATGSIINDAGLIKTDQIIMHSNRLSNVGGSIMQSGIGNTLISVVREFNDTEGTVVSNGALVISASDINNQSGKLFGQGVVTFTSSGNMNNSNHGYVSGAELTLNVAGNVDNTTGKIEGKTGLDLHANNLINDAGTIQNLGTSTLNLQLGQRLSNTQNTDVSGFVGSAGNIAAHATDVDNSNGIFYSKNDLQIHADGSIINMNGVIQSDNAIYVDANNIINNQSGRIEANGNGDIADPARPTLLATSHQINNMQGRIAHSGSGHALIRGELSIDNEAGIIGGSGDITLNTGSLYNIQNGQVITAGDLNLQVGDSLNNTQGSLFAEKNLVLRQGNISVINQQGSISASGNIILDVANMDNTQGRIVSSAANARNSTENSVDNGTGNIVFSAASSIVNTEGVIASRKNLGVQTRSLSGEGSVLAGQDAIISLQGDYTFTAHNLFRANRDFTFAATGAITNTANLESVGNLTLSADNISNLYGALINSGKGATTLKATQAVFNIGRIYGNDVAIGANSILNDGAPAADEEIPQGGVIAARRNVDLGARTIVNQEHAVIQSLGNMAIGGKLDNNHRATGRGADLQNVSAIIESGADLNVQVAQISNANNHFSTDLQRDVSLNRHVKYYLIDGSAIGDLILSGEILNDKSVIMAGGSLVGEMDAIENRDAPGVIRVHRGGDGVNYFTERSYLLHHGVVEGCNNFGFHCKDEDHYDGYAAYDEYLPDTYVALNIVQQFDNQHATPLNNDAVNTGVGTSQIPTGNISTITGNKQNQELAGIHETVGLVTKPIANLALHNNLLFPITTKPGANYLIETDPKFSNYQIFLSSDYMLSRLAIDPQRAQKRLGDGFYEQKLINDQIAQLTGKRFLGDFRTNEQQYQALMESGVTAAEQFQLTPGIALTASQMALLTSDMVWLVAQEVTLPDGSKDRVLVPVVYLAHINTTNLESDGSIISGRDIDLNVKANIKNGGTLLATNSVLVRATDITNSGTIRTNPFNGSAVLIADNDIINKGGKIGGTRVDVLAGRDILLDTTVSENQISNKNAQHGFSSERRWANNVASVKADLLNIQSGRDISLTAAQIATSGNASIVAGRDLNLESLITKDAFSLRGDERNSLSISQTHIAGTQVSTGGNLVMLAKQDINAQAAYVNSVGEISLSTGRDVNLIAGQNESKYAQQTYISTSNLLSSSSTSTDSHKQGTQSLGTTYYSGDKIQVIAGNNVNVTGSTMVGDKDVAVVARKNINVIASQDKAQRSYLKEESTSGLFSTGMSITLGSKEEKNTAVDNQVISNASTIGSNKGHIALVADNNYTQNGSNVIALTGDINIAAKSADITAVQDNYIETNKNQTKQSGLTLSVSAPTITALQTVRQMSSAANQTDDKRMKSLAGVTAASEVYSAISAAKNPTSGATVSLTIGSSEGESQSTQKTSAVMGSNLAAGGDISISATNAGNNSHLTIAGTDITAEKNTFFKADGNINLVAAQGSRAQNSRNSMSSAAIGVAATYGSEGFSYGLTANASVSRGNADGSDVTFANTHINAGNTLVWESGGDTNVVGAVTNSKQVLATVGTSGSGSLNIRSLQDTSNYGSKDESLGGSVIIGYGAVGSLNYGKNKANSDLANVGEQSAIKAGEDGFAINVNGNTNLSGGVIASTAVPDRNILVTQTLTQSDIQNYAHANVDSTSSGLSSDMLTQGKYGASKAIASALLSNSDESGSSTGTTRSAISSGTVIISDNQMQQELAGMDADRTIASLNRDTENTHTAAKQQDVLAMKQKVAANQTIKQAALTEAIKFTDESYRTAFIKKVNIYAVEKDAEGKVIERKLSDTEKVSLQAGKDGKVHIANNGIFNDKDAAAKYADQHTTVDDSPQYLIHYPEAANGISELLVVGYQYYLENDFMGLSNAVEETKNLMNQYGKDGLHLDGHSRGSITIGNALESLQNQPIAQGSLSGTTINFFGPAYSAQQADAILSHLQNRDLMTNLDDKNKAVLKFENHLADFVGGLIGRNPGTGGTIPDGSSFIEEGIKAVYGENTVHNCYGHSIAKACGQFWRWLPNSQPVLQPVRKY